MKKRLFRLILIILSLPILLVILAAVAYLMANHTNGALLSSGEKRTYLLYVPESYDASLPAPLVISIHGFSEWPAHQMQISHWNDLADQYGFIVVYPSGTHFPLRWHTHGDLKDDVDPLVDVRFISDLIDELSTEYNIDPDRIYANGLSNGGGMSFVLACQLSERIAAISTVAGAYLLPWEQCQPSRPVPTIVFHGTADPIVPYNGGPSDAFDIPFPNIPDWVGILANRSGCDETPLRLPTVGDVSGIQYTNCAADVVFYTISGGGHAWPGGDPLPKSIVGHTSMDINATQTMWDFFQQHSLTTSMITGFVIQNP